MLHGKRCEFVRAGGLTRNANRIVSLPVDAAFLAAAMTFCANHPDDRAGIGTPQGERATGLTEQLLTFGARKVINLSALDLNRAVRATS